MVNYRHPLLSGLYKEAYVPPPQPQGGAPGSTDAGAGGAGGAGGTIPPELLRIMMAGPPAGSVPGGGEIPDPNLPSNETYPAGTPPYGGSPEDMQAMAGTPGGMSPEMSSGMPSENMNNVPSNNVAGAPPSDVTAAEAAQVSPDVVVDHLAQLQSALAVLQEGIKQLRRIIDSISSVRDAGGVSEVEEPKSAYYRGLKPDINELLEALKHLG